MAGLCNSLLSLLIRLLILLVFTAVTKYSPFSFLPFPSFLPLTSPNFYLLAFTSSISFPSSITSLFPLISSLSLFRKLAYFFSVSDNKKWPKSLNQISIFEYIVLKLAISICLSLTVCCLRYRTEQFFLFVLSILIITIDIMSVEYSMSSLFSIKIVQQNI